MCSDVTRRLRNSRQYIKILVVEDHSALAENIFEYLGEQYYALDFARDGLTALHLLATNAYDVIVLDVMLPGISGFTLCQRIREDLKCSTPILFMTARDSIEDKESGFLYGADDYLVKPFEMREFELRIQALAKRCVHKKGNMQAGQIFFEPGTFTVRLFDKSVELTGLNIELFSELLRYYPGYVSHENLSYAAWGVDDIDVHRLRTHIYNLRKLLLNSLGYTLIKTLRSQGYKLQSPANE
ncbi:hypothetical protein MNBD_GAMMA12-1393 [hydrothermal vent metagenome]|uniref:Two-component transcriptional response regulator, LuxR family n=1 Tax=hydrothermal vent metagenome TaxID=652676 RepID=A0A3B0YAV9_9ZZZZ